MVGTGRRSLCMSHRADPRESRRTLQCTTPQPSRKGRKTMLSETIGAAFRSSAMPIANDRVHLVPYCDQLFEDHLRLRMALYPAIRPQRGAARVPTRSCDGIRKPKLFRSAVPAPALREPRRGISALRTSRLRSQASNRRAPSPSPAPLRSQLAQSNHACFSFEASRANQDLTNAQAMEAKTAKAACNRPSSRNRRGRAPPAHRVRAAG